jgi:hypothetical protein
VVDPIQPSQEDTMSTSAPTRGGMTDRENGAPASRTTVRRLATETKAAFKTTEFFAFVLVLAGILIAGAIVDSSDAGGFGARQVWLYATILTVGYMISRGLAKSGSRDLPARPGRVPHTTRCGPGGGGWTGEPHDDRHPHGAAVHRRDCRRTAHPAPGVRPCPDGR